MNVLNAPLNVPGTWWVATDEYLAIPPVGAIYTSADPAVIARNTPHGLLLVDAGRLAPVGGVRAAVDAAVERAEPRFDINGMLPDAHVNELRRGYRGFKRKAACVLYKPLPNGMPADEVDDFLLSPSFSKSIKWGMLLARGQYWMPPVIRAGEVNFRGWTNHAPRRPNGFCRVRIDVYIETVRSNQTFGVGERADGYGTFHVPYTLNDVTGGGLVNFGDMAAIDELIAQVRNEIDRFRQGAVAIGQSDRIFKRLVGLHVWSTPSVAVRVGGGVSPNRANWTKGIIDAGIRDGKCVARSVLTGFDPVVHPCLYTSATHLLDSAIKGAEADLVTATRSACPMQIAQASDRVSALRHAAAKMPCTEGIPQWSTIGRRSGAIESFLVRALSKTGKRPAHLPVDLSDPMFGGPVELSKPTIVALRSALAVANCKVNIWVEAGSNRAITLVNQDPGATLEFVMSGGRVVNLLEADGHAWVVASVNAVNSQLLNRRICCELCGFTAFRTSPTSKFCARTLVSLHQERGCAMVPLSMTAPLSTRNIRQLSTLNFNMRWPLSVYATIYEAAGGFACAVLVNTSLGWCRLENTPAWREYFRRHSNPTNVRMCADAAFVTACIPADRDTVRREVYATVAEVLETLAAETDILSGALFARMPRLRDAPPLVRADEPCFFCRFPLTGPPRNEVQASRCAAEWDAGDVGADGVDEEDEIEYESMDSGRVPSLPVQTHCPSTGVASWAHESCSVSAHRTAWPNNVLLVDVSTLNAMNGVVEAVMMPSFFDRVSAGRIPVLQTQPGRGVQFVSVFMSSPGIAQKRGRSSEADDTRASFSLRFRAPREQSEMVQRSIKTDGTAATQADAFAFGMVAWGDRGLDATHLNPLMAATDISYARTALFDSTTETVTSLVSQESLDFYSRMTLGGRLITGCAVLHPPLTSPCDRRVARLWLDVNSMYPSMLLRHALPSAEHTDRQLADFSDTLDAGIEFLRSEERQRELGPGMCMSVELTGSFPPSVHASLVQFAPLFERLSVGSDVYTPFQRERLSMHAKPIARTLAHLLPVESFPVFLVEARKLLSLGFVPTRIGQVRGCSSSFWAVGFARDGQLRRRHAMKTGDKIVVDDTKRMMNCVIGATNQDTSRHTTLRAVLSSAITPGTLETPGRAGKRGYAQYFANDVRFTGRVLECGGVTLVEREAAPGRYHQQQTVFSLAVQAYARCAHLDLWYGTRVGGGPGVLDAFADARLLYGNTDSLMIEVSLSDAHIAAGETDARQVLYKVLRDRMDVSNVPEDSTFWKGLPPEWKTAAVERMGEWGCVKEETGMAGIEAFVVNGPNRWGAKIVASETDTLPIHKGAVSDTVLKTLQKTHIGASLEEYAANWGGADGVCTWKNTACLVHVDGTQWPIGTVLPAVHDAMAWEPSDVLPVP